MKTIRRSAAFLPDLFGVIALSLMLVFATQSCRFGRAKAQDDGDGIILETNFCNRAYYIEHYGEPDWHLYWALHMCWLYTEPSPSHAAPLSAPSPRPRRFVIGGR